jgi:Protein of unknown function (DUF1592)/Protein of unknown function (DUF1588)/Protein of unknown function (DUF1595)/Protein of unknown function (DUF1587)/Protein of unknown function (DUF1585)
LHYKGVTIIDKSAARGGLTLAVASGALLLACTARIEGVPDAALPASGNAGSSGNPGNPGSSGSAGSAAGDAAVPHPTTLPQPSACKTNNPGPRALRRLTALEYSATLKDLFGDPSVPLTTVFSDPTVLGFAVDSQALVIQGLGAQQLMDQAESVARWAVTTHLGKLSSCTTNDATCRQSFIRSFGRRVHRAPLSDADVALYDGLFAAEASFNDGVEAVTAAMLQSPHFLYRQELGANGGGGFQLSSHELASALAYLFTGSMPDDELAAAADTGSLNQPAELQRHAERLLQSPRGHQVIGSFMRDWLGLGKLDTVAKDDSVFKLTPELRAAMGEETRQLIDDAIYSKNSSFTALLTAKSSFVNQQLASHYGLKNAGSLGTQFTSVTFDPSERDSGLLAQGSLLTALSTAAESSPVQRGKMVRTRLLCEPLPPPPANVDTSLKPPAGGVTTREHFAEHANNPMCASCHKLMDPIGYGFEHYDAFGRRREQDNGQPVDASGSVYRASGEVSFDGLPGLTNYLATEGADTVNACLVRYWAYFAFGTAGWSEDQCTYDSITEQAKLDGFALKAVAKAIVNTPRFTRRAAE